MKTGQIALSIGGLVALVILAKFLKDKETDVNKKIKDKAFENSSSSAATTKTADTVLKIGDTGPMVKELQYLLNTHYLVGFAPLAKDGVFGEATQQAVEIVTGGFKKISVNNLKELL